MDKLKNIKTKRNIRIEQKKSRKKTKKLINERMNNEQ